MAAAPVTAPNDDVTTLIPPASASKFFVSLAVPWIALRTSSIASRKSPAFLVSVSNFACNSRPADDFFSSSDIARYCRVNSAISCVNTRNCVRIFCVGSPLNPCLAFSCSCSRLMRCIFAPCKLSARLSYLMVASSILAVSPLAIAFSFASAA